MNEYDLNKMKIKAKDGVIEYDRRLNELSKHPSFASVVQDFKYDQLNQFEQLLRVCSVGDVAKLKILMMQSFFFGCAFHSVESIGELKDFKNKNGKL